MNLIRLLMAAALCVAGPAAFAQNWPEKPIRIVVSYPPGASSDTTARLIGQKLSESLGQSVVVDNRAGASGNIGAEHVAKSAPDGYTLLIGTDATHSANYHMAKNPSFDPIRDFTPITQLANNLLILVANVNLPATNARELITYAKANPGKLAYGSSGNGSPHHLAGALFNQMAGTDIAHVPYKGGSIAVTDTMGGQIQLTYSSLVTVIQHVKSGKLKAIGMTDKARYPGLPEVPSLAETLPGFEMNSWLGLFAPAGLPASILDRVHQATVAALRSPDVRNKLEGAGLLPIGNTPAQFAAIQKSDFERRGKLIKSANIQGD